MSTIANLSSAGIYSSYPGTSGYGQNLPNLSTPGSAPQSGDLTAAQKALAALESGTSSNANTSDPDGDGDAPDTSTADSLTNNTEASADYDSMVKDLGSGDLTAAEKAFANLQTDLKVHGPHHHRGSSNGTRTDPTSSDSTSGNVINVTV